MRTKGHPSHLNISTTREKKETSKHMHHLATYLTNDGGNTTCSVFVNAFNKWLHTYIHIPRSPKSLLLNLLLFAAVLKQTLSKDLLHLIDLVLGRLHFINSTKQTNTHQSLLLL